jgi:galactokinase
MLMRHKDGIKSFRDIRKWENLLPYEAEMGELVYMRCLYVVQEIARTQEAAIYLKDNNLIEFGRLMNESHDGLSRLYNVSCKELDFLAAHAQQNEHVIGARMMGGGFGGCTINIVKDEAVDSFITDITTAYQQQFQVSPEAFVVETSDGVRELSL